MEQTYYVYETQSENYFVSKSKHWADNKSPHKQIAKIKAIRVSDRISPCKTPIEIGAIGATTCGTTIKVVSVEMIKSSAKTLEEAN